MKKFIMICLSCSLALAAGATAQQEDASPAAKKKQHEKAQAAPHEKPAARAHADRSAPKPRAAAKAKEPAAAAENARPQNAAGPRQKERHAAKAQAKAQDKAKANDLATPAPAQPRAQDHPKANARAKNQPKAEAQPKAEDQTKAESKPNQPKAAGHRVAAQKRKPDVQAIKAQHSNFHAQARPQQVPSVTFSQSRRISGSDHWQGERYAAFRSYHPQRRDLGYYRSHYSRVELIGGGYYYFNAGYWYPAWTNQPSQQYYVYDGPIYAGRAAQPPDQVIADVQASLQDLGYYTGEVDGLLGPLTRQALTGYQSDNGLYTTAAIDEPTLSSLGLD